MIWLSYAAKKIFIGKHSVSICIHYIFNVNDLCQGNATAVNECTSLVVLLHLPTHKPVKLTTRTTMVLTLKIQNNVVGLLIVTITNKHLLPHLTRDECC